MDPNPASFQKVELFHSPFARKIQLEDPFSMKYTEYLKTGKLDPPPSCKGRWARDHFNSHIREWAKMLSKYGESYFDRHYRQHTLAEKL